MIILSHTHILIFRRLSRVGKTELDIGGYKIPEGIELAFAVYALHRDPEFWPEPEKFDPERYVTLF